ncbi:NAD(P)-dependent oxidoreductase [Halobacteriales archaeon QS_1_68_17]|nr:MAG: NAD(P)-dependent oxidoreductase [Halobacteriales archaeon QS_1_68_17]
MSSGNSLDGSVSIVTGAGGDIGAGIAVALAEAGSDVVLGVHNDQDVAGRIEELGQRAYEIQVDVEDADSVQSMIDETVAEFGGFDVLVNNAGIVTVAPIRELTEEEWDRVMDVNAKGTFLVTKAALPHLVRASGTIVNVSSISGLTAAPDHSHYGASKHAIVGFTRALSRELAPDDVTVNALCPGIVYSKMWSDQMEPHKEESYEETVERVIPLGRDQTVEDMGQAAVYLATAPNVTGETLAVDGGILQNTV